jgi:hypothetical protein
MENFIKILTNIFLLSFDNILKIKFINLFLIKRTRIHVHIKKLRLLNTLFNQKTDTYMKRGEKNPKIS